MSSRATLSQYLYLVGLQHASVAFAAAFINLAPASTFLMALAFRLETLKLKSKGGKAKMLGSLVCIGGVILLALYRGIPTNKLAHLHESLNGAKDVNLKASGKSPESYAVGSILLTSSVMLWCSWFLLQAKIGKRYPYKYSSTAIMSSFSAIQSAILCFAINRDISIWVLKGKLQIISVLFAVSTLLGMIVSIRTGAQARPFQLQTTFNIPFNVEPLIEVGIVASGLGYVGMSWCVEKWGPVFTAAFSPFTQIFVAILNLIFLHEQIYLGSVLGSAVVICGLYILLWGKSKEEAEAVHENQASPPSTSCVIRVPGTDSRCA
ncbi:hypothetical protein Ancab_036687 [Ancistrocladus abbreviatus]